MPGAACGVAGLALLTALLLIRGGAGFGQQSGLSVTAGGRGSVPGSDVDGDTKRVARNPCRFVEALDWGAV